MSALLPIPVWLIWLGVACVMLPGGTWAVRKIIEIDKRLAVLEDRLKGGGCDD